MKYLLHCLTLLICAGAVKAQVTIFTGDTLPNNPKLNDWYSKSYSTNPKIWNGKEWQELQPKFNGFPTHWQNLIKVKQGDMQAYFFSDGKPFLTYTHWLLPLDSVLLGYVCGKGTFLLNKVGDTLAYSPGSSHNLPAQYLSVNEQHYFCMPAYLPGLKYSHDIVMRNWGLLNTRGEWVIPPQFDQKFDLQDGKAEVFLKGERQVWSLQGQRLE